MASANVELHRRMNVAFNARDVTDPVLPLIPRPRGRPPSRGAAGVAGLAASANVDLVRSIYAAWGRGDFSPTECLHPEDGKVTRFVAYWDRDRALADLGLKA